MTPDIPLTTAARTVEVLETVRECDGATVAELTAELELPKSTVHDYVKTLAEVGYLTTENGEYDLSLRFLSHGMYVRDHVALATVIEPYLEDLATRTNETVWYIVEEGGEGVYVEGASGDDALQPYASVGARSDLHSIAGGKAILSWLPDERIDEIVAEHGLERRTARTITSREELEEARSRIRDRGYAVNWGENIDGWRAVASPIVVDGELYGAVAVAGPENRLEGTYFEEELPKRTTATANEVQLQLRSSTTE